MIGIGLMDELACDGHQTAGSPPENKPDKTMSPFHSDLNHWQRQWLSDRLHKKHQPTSPPAPIPMGVEAPKRRKNPRPKTKPPESAGN